MKIGIYCTTHKSVPPKEHGGVQLINWITADALVEAGYDVYLFANEKSSTIAKHIIMPVGSGEGHEKELAIRFQKQIERMDVLIDTSTFSYPGRLFKDLRYLVRTGGDCNKRYCQFWDRNIVFPSADHAMHHSRNDCSCSKKRGIQKPKILRKPVGYWLYSRNIIDFDKFSKQSSDYYSCLSSIEPIKGTHLSIEFARKANIRLIIAGPIKDKQYYQKEIKPFLNNKICYIGELPSQGKTKWEFLGGAKALVFTTNCHDADPNAPKESLMVKTPVIGLRKGATAEIVSDGFTGVLGNSINELVERIGELDNINPDDCQKEVLHKFSVETFINGLINYCEAVANGVIWY